MAAALPPGLHVNDNFNPEEAAHVAGEFVASLDNLPGEVCFLLEEIREKDNRINSLINRIHSRHQGLTRNISKTISSSSSTSTPSTPTGAGSSSSYPALPIPQGAPLPTSHLSSKEQTTVAKIQGEWAKVFALQDEKVHLAERLERIVGRARERGRIEWRRVGGKDLEEVEGELIKGGGGGGVLGVGGGAVGELGGGEVMLPAGGLGSGMDGRGMKKRKPQALPLPLPMPSPSIPIIHPPPSTHPHHPLSSHSSSMPPPPAPTTHRPHLSSRHARHARHISSSSGGLSEDPDADADGDGEEVGELGDNDDQTLYCTCRQRSYGEMIGCDNEKCEYEWFHVKCVNISGTLPDTWYCPDCVRKLGLSSSDGKVAGGRDKKGRKR